MKERPILIQGWGVQAILDDRKTNTRRVIKLRAFQKSDTPGYDWQFRDRRCLWNDISHKRLMELCPYGQPGDLLWVRETWGAWPFMGGGIQVGSLCYRADGEYTGISAKNWCWRPSIHLPKKYARLWLRITNIRVERVQDISEDDAIAEGADAISMADVPRQATMSRRADFRQLWNSLNSKRGYSWESNPWVWVIIFERANKYSTDVKPPLFRGEEDEDHG